MTSKIINAEEKLDIFVDDVKVAEINPAGLSITGGLSVSGAAPGAGGTQRTITQANTYTTADVGRPLYISQPSGSLELAKADTATTAEVDGMILAVQSGTQFTLSTGGSISGIAASVFTEGVLPNKGDVVWLSSTQAGKLTVTPPSASYEPTTDVDKPLGRVTDKSTTVTIDRKSVV